MTWNWQQADWPNFKYSATELEALESKFLQQSGLLFGAHKHVAEKEKESLRIELISAEALKTSEIEGEYLDRDSLQSSIRRHFGLESPARRIPPAEQGIAEMMVDLYKNYSAPLSHETLFAWHEMLAKGRRDLTDIGRYRTHESPMQIVSGPAHKPKIHFEAPPSCSVERDMHLFVEWFNQNTGTQRMPALTQAGFVHLWFVSIHPFEDGNGRIGRALSEKALAQKLGQPTLIALSQTIQRNKRAYYDALERNSTSNEITDWLVYFANTLLEAQSYSLAWVDFIIEKAKLFDRLRDQLNPRQEEALARMFREGPDGFKGGLSADNYISITGASRATTTRDLHDLVSKQALRKTGEKKGTRYYLNVSTN